MTDQPFDESQRWLELGIAGADTRIVLFTADAHRDRIGTFSNIVFASDNVEKTYRELAARGVEFVSPPRKEEWGTSVVFKDVDGNQFVLASSAAEFLDGR